MPPDNTFQGRDPRIIDVDQASERAFWCKSLDISEAELLALVAAVERESEHPLAEAIVLAAERRGAANRRADDFESVPGHGARATVDGRRVAVGNRRLMEREGVELGSLEDRRRQLAEGGRMLIPVGGRDEQMLAVFTRRGDDLARRDILPVRFVPLIGAHGWHG